PRLLQMLLMGLGTATSRPAAHPTDSNFSCQQYWGNTSERDVMLNKRLIELKTAVSEKLLAPAAMSAHAGQAGVLSFERQIARTAVHAIGVRQITPTGQGVVCVYVDSPSDDIETRLKEEITLTIGQIPVNVIRCLPARFLGAGALPCCGSDRLDTLR